MFKYLSSKLKALALASTLALAVNLQSVAAIDLTVTSGETTVASVDTTAEQVATTVESTTTIQGTEVTTTTSLVQPKDTQPVETTTLPALPKELSDPTFDKEGSRFTLTILPDTQFYSRYGTESSGNQYEKFGINPFDSQTNWIVKNAQKYNDQLTLHLGDVVDQAGKGDQWEVADRAMKILEDGGHPYSILAGNHDQDYGLYYYNEHFNAERAKKNSTLQDTYVHDFGTFQAKGHEFHKFNVNGQDFINIALSWNIGDQYYAGVLDWAENILKANPNTPTIITSHQIINVDTTTNEAIDTEFGNKIWDRLINPYNQVFMTYNGHHHGATHRMKNNQFNNPVLQVLTDHQMAYMGGNGYMVMAELDLTNSKIHHTTFSPWVLEKPKDTLTPFDEALMKAPGATFTYDFDFLKRFPNLVLGPTTKEAYTKKLRQDLLANYTDPQVQPLQPAENAEDYVEVEGTVAHWRMSKGREEFADNTPLPVGSNIVDIFDNRNNMVRVPSSGPAAPDDVLFSTDHSPFSSDAGSIIFNNVSRNAEYPDGSKGQKTHLFSTSNDAPINLEEFKNGYTFETFVKISENFTSDNNRWMRWLARGGFRKDYENYDEAQGDEGEPLFQWALSNLKEIQFSLADAKDPSEGTSAWSGEITNLGQWIHLAAVNDPITKTITMFVDGQPVLRNAVNQLGISSLGLPWLIGGDYYENKEDPSKNGIPGHGFLGAIGETRLVNRVLESSEWLTARRPKPAPVDPTPTEPVDPKPTDSTPVDPEDPLFPEPSQPAEQKDPVAPKPSQPVVEKEKPEVKGPVKVIAPVKASQPAPIKETVQPLTSLASNEYVWVDLAEAIKGLNLWLNSQDLAKAIKVIVTDLLAELKDFDLAFQVAFEQDGKSIESLTLPARIEVALEEGAEVASVMAYDFEKKAVGDAINFEVIPASESWYTSTRDNAQEGDQVLVIWLSKPTTVVVEYK